MIIEDNKMNVEKRCSHREKEVLNIRKFLDSRGDRGGDRGGSRGDRGGSRGDRG